MVTKASVRLDMLLVEDDEVDVMNVRRAFKRKQISTPLLVARNGLDALKMLRTKDDKAPQETSRPKMVLLDLNMPRMNGLEFLKELRSDPDLQRTPVVVLTTSDDDRDRERAYSYNVAGYFLKTAAFDQFADAMETMSNYWSLCEMP